VRIVVRRRRARRTLAETPEVAELRKQAKAYLPGRLAELAAQHGFSYNQVRIKHNVSNWGSCSVKKNINLNLNLMRLPAELRDYVMLHELCHLKYMNHGKEFHALLESICPNHKALRRQLRDYKLL
jgi:predicted metal-dependent hydrolase